MRRELGTRTFSQAHPNVTGERVQNWLAVVLKQFSAGISVVVAAAVAQLQCVML